MGPKMLKLFIIYVKLHNMILITWTPTAKYSIACRYFSKLVVTIAALVISVSVDENVWCCFDPQV